MITFVYVLLTIFGILEIILFFKLWGMTDDVKEIKRRAIKAFPYEEELSSAVFREFANPQKPSITECGIFHVGDYVVYEPMNRRMVVKAIKEDGSIECCSYKANGKEEFEGVYKPEQIILASK